jgi:hypothetical protein
MLEEEALEAAKEKALAKQMERLIFKRSSSSSSVVVNI